MHKVGHITQLLAEIHDGGESATDELFLLTCSELRRLAETAMRGQSADHILQPTALVNEAVARILNSNSLQRTENRRMFYGLAARAMRSVLVDYARRNAADRRNPNSGLAETFAEQFVSRFEREAGVDLLILNEALETLRSNSERHYDVVIMRFFGGFRAREIADCLNVSVSTVEKDWALSRAWLRKALGEDS